MSGEQQPYDAFMYEIGTLLPAQGEPIIQASFDPYGRWVCAWAQMRSCGAAVRGWLAGRLAHQRSGASALCLPPPELRLQRTTTPRMQHTHACTGCLRQPPAPPRSSRLRVPRGCAGARSCSGP